MQIEQDIFIYGHFWVHKKKSNSRKTFLIKSNLRQADQTQFFCTAQEMQKFFLLAIRRKVPIKSINANLQFWLMRPKAAKRTVFSNTIDQKILIPETIWYNIWKNFPFLKKNPFLQNETLSSLKETLSFSLSYKKCRHPFLLLIGRQAPLRGISSFR